MKKTKYTPGEFDLHVKRSSTGKGLFTKTFIPKDKCIVEYTGIEIKEEDQHKVNSRYLFETGKGLMINGNIPSNIARYINHSCAPNCEANGPRGKVFIFSIKKINPGEELTYNYGKEYFDKYFKKTGCKCNKCSTKNIKN